MSAIGIPFVDRDVQEVFASRIVKVERLSAGIIRFYLGVEEAGPDGPVYVLALKLLVPVEGVLAHQPMIAAALIGEDQPQLAGEPAPLH